MAVTRRTTSGGLLRALALALLTLGATLQAADSLRIVPLVRDGMVLVTFELGDGFTDDVRAAIRSGLRTTFTYTVDLRLAAPVWIDRTIASAVVSTSVVFDNLTRRHTIVRTLDGRVEETRVTDDDAVVRTLMTNFERLPLFKTSTLEPNKEYYVKVRAQVKPQSAGYIWPWDSGRSAQTKFTFIP